MSNTSRVAKTGDIDDVARLIYEIPESNFKANHTTDYRKCAEHFYVKNMCFEKYIELYESVVKNS